MFNETRFDRLVNAANANRRFLLSNNTVAEVSLWEGTELEWFKTEMKKELGYVAPLTEEQTNLREEAEKLQDKLYE